MASLAAGLKVAQLVAAVSAQVVLKHLHTRCVPEGLPLLEGGGGAGDPSCEISQQRATLPWRWLLSVVVNVAV